MKNEISASDTATVLQKQLLTDFSEVFDSLGCLPGYYKVQLDTSILPVVEPCRRIPFALHDRVRAELQRMEDIGVIAKVTQPTDWVSGMVIATKKNGELRLCIDPRNLNKAVKREHYQITREELMSKFANKRYFTKLDARHGFWQVRLDYLYCVP